MTRIEICKSADIWKKISTFALQARNTYLAKQEKNNKWKQQ